MAELKQVADRGSRSVEATVSYTRRVGEPLRSYFRVDPPPGEPESNRVNEPHEVLIESMREVPDGPRLDREGFQVADFVTTVDDIYDAEQRERVYAPEVAAMVKAITGATKVRIANHVLRGAEAQRRNPEALYSVPQDFAHADYATKLGPERLKDFFPEYADELGERRTAIINIWRPIVGPMRDRPLAVCDVRSLDARDLVDWVTISRAAPAKNGDDTHSGPAQHTIGTSAVLTWNASHRWYYVPDMMPDEALLFYQHDSTRPEACFPHTAFTDPTTPANAPGRASIDVRAFVLW